MQNQAPVLAASPRTVFGKKVRFLRRAGSVPANVFGPGVASSAIQIDTKDIEHVLTHVPRSSLLSLVVGPEPPTTVLIRGVMRKPTTGEIYHVDLYRVSMTQRLRTAIALAFEGESPAARSHGATIAHSVDSVEVECLPGDLPSRIVVDLGVLQEIDDTIYVRDLQLPAGVVAITSPDQMVARALAPRVLEVGEEPAEAAEPAEEEKAE
jgi:large subunit ribosomal protein L25